MRIDKKMRDLALESRSHWEGPNSEHAGRAISLVDHMQHCFYKQIERSKEECGEKKVRENKERK